MVFEQLRGEADRVGRSHGAIGPNIERQLVVVGHLPEPSRLHGVIHLADR